MGEDHHKYTGILLVVFALLILFGAIFFTIAYARVMDTAEYKAGNGKMNSAKNNLLVAFILGYIAAGMGIVLAILYFGHVAWGVSSEIPHAILFVLLFLLVIVSGIFGFIALSNIDGANSSDKKGAPGWIWSAQIAGLIALIVIIISGAWRFHYNTTKPKTETSITTTNMKPQSELTFTAPSTVYTQPPVNVPSYPAPALGSSSLPTVSYNSPTVSYNADMSSYQV